MKEFWAYTNSLGEDFIFRDRPHPRPNLAGETCLVLKDDFKALEAYNEGLLTKINELENELAKLQERNR